MKNITRFLLKPTIEAIYDILHMENCKVNGIAGVPDRNKLSISPGHIDLEFDETFRAMHASIYIEYLPEIMLETANGTYKIPQHTAQFEGSITMGGEEKQHFDMRFNKLIQSTLVEGCPYFWRFIYPISNNEWFMKIKALPYADDFGTQHFFNLITADLEGHKMNLYSSNVDNNHWMIVESTDPITYEEMDHRGMSIIMALGFVIGKRYGDYCFHVASVEPSFSKIEGIEALSLKETRFCPFKILQPNSNLMVEWLRQFDYQQYALDEIQCTSENGTKWFYEEDASVTIEAFSKLAQLCYKTNDMLLATSMLIDGSLMNIEYQKPFFHVALETIASALIKEDELLLPPTMPQENYMQEVVPRLLDALKGIMNLPEEAFWIFSRRIEHNLNSAPNANKLEICFSKYGYMLTREDKLAINKRNSTFHGHLTSENIPLREPQSELLAMSLRLHKLCSILLLKAAGFTGKVLNNEVLFGIKDACERKEHIYLGI